VKQPKLSAEHEERLFALHRACGDSGAELAELFGVARSTVYGAID
jgi:hypothetical protein